MEKIYCVSVSIKCDDYFDTREIQTSFLPTSLFKTKEGAKNYMKELHDSFSDEFPELKHALTEKHACIWEEKPRFCVEYEPLEIWIRINELPIHD